MLDPLSHYLQRNAGQHGPVILMYHAVMPGSSNPDWPWGVSMRRFRSHLDFLAAEGWRTPTMAQLVAHPELYKGRTAVITFDDGYVDNLAACEELKKRNMHASWFVVAGSLGKTPEWPDDGRPSGRLLNASELNEMLAAGMEIGSHGVGHVRLTEVDDAGLHMELHGSRDILQNAVGKAICSFAYPYGAWDIRCEEAARQAGYTAACTTRTGWALLDNNPYQLRRLTVFNTDTQASLARKISLGSHDISWQALTHYGLKRLRKRLAF